MRVREHTPWSRVGEIAGRQWSQIRHAQLLDAGLSRQQIPRSVERGLLFPSFQSVFSVGHPLATPRERAMAATLAYWPEGLLDAHWALWNYDLIRLPAHDPDVAASPSRHKRRGITLHRTKHLGRPDHNHGIPTVTPNRAIIAAAPSLPAKQLRRVVNQAQIANLTTAESLRHDALQTRGIPTAQLLLHLPEDQHGATRSLLEDLLSDLSRERRLPAPEVNAIVEGVVHGTRIAFEDDHAKRLHLEARGKRVVAVTYRQVTRERDRTADQLEAVIRASATSTPRAGAG